MNLVLTCEIGHGISQSEFVADKEQTNCNKATHSQD